MVMDVDLILPAVTRSGDEETEHAASRKSNKNVMHMPARIEIVSYCFISLCLYMIWSILKNFQYFNHRSEFRDGGGGGHMITNIMPVPSYTCTNVKCQ